MLSRAGPGVRSWISGSRGFLLLGAATVFSFSGCGTKSPLAGGPSWSGPVRESSLIPPGSSTSPLPEKLFESEVPLILTLEADFHQLRQDREEENEERPGRVLLRESTGMISLPVEIKTRGRFRLNPHTCSLPPLRLDFPSDSVAGTTLEGLDKVKLVTHCQDKDAFEQNVLEEYLAYRIYGLLTEVGFRVQLALITYRDITGEEDEVSRVAFLIESEDAVAQRLEGEFLEVEQVNPNSFVPRQAGLMYLFQYLIGNTDWSVIRSHNMKYIRIGGDYHPIPFDFDFSGLVDASYAGPSPMVGRWIDDVRDRLFWGICSEQIDYPALLSHFNRHREAIVELVQSQPGLKAWNRHLATSYVESFYDIINDERTFDFQILNGCRRIGERVPRDRGAKDGPRGSKKDL